MGGIAAALVSASLVAMPCYVMEKATLFRIMKDHQELPAAGGLLGSNVGTVVVFSSKNGETFSIAMIFPNGNACLTAVGSDWSTWTPSYPDPDMKEH